MAKQQKKKTPPQNKKLSSYIRIQNKKQQPLAPPSTNSGIKRPVSDLRTFLSKEDSISPPSIQIKRSIQYHLKNTSIDFLIAKCQNLRKAIQIMQNQTKINKQQIKSVLQRNLHGSSFSLWGDKYFPRNIAQCLDRQLFSNKIVDWIKSFFQYRNTIIEQSNSFVDDISEEAQNSLQKNMKQLRWKMKGLILKGRDGVGKNSLLKAVSKQMKYDLYHCGNDNNQIKYLRQKNQATQSQSVKIKINKHDALMHRTNKTITQFTIQKQDKKKQGQTKKIQFMHNVNIFYPQTDSVRFLTELNKSVDCSKIPFIMTVVGQKVPELLKNYDIIEYEQAKFQKIAQLMFLILHVEKNVKIDKQKQIQKQKVYEQINNQFENFHFCSLTSMKQVLHLVNIFDGKMDKIFTFLHQNYFFKLSQAQKIQKISLTSKKPIQLLQDYFLIKKQNKISQSNTETDQIDPSKYLVQSQQNIILQTPQKIVNQKKQLLTQIDKTVTVKKNRKNSLNDNQTQKQQSLEQRLKYLKLITIEDQKCKLQIENQQSYLFNKLSNSMSQQAFNLQQKIIDNIPLKTHTDIRKSIIRNLKKQWQVVNQNANFSIKPKQLCYLPLILGMRGRSSRKQRNQTNQLSKFLKNQQIHYLHAFTQLIKSE